ncbi:MAG TPA: 50S ribosomal protein L4, partial [Clostridiales bacterium]|nr:50S ribosomal protein L4 [Clostridiales bacterium]
ILKNLNVEKKALIVLDQKNENVIKSAANIPGVSTTLVTALNVYDILNHDKFIVLRDAVHKIEEVYA